MQLTFFCQVTVDKINSEHLSLHKTDSILLSNPCCLIICEHVWLFPLTTVFVCLNQEFRYIIYKSVLLF